jgi:hypothetical protein
MSEVFLFTYKKPSTVNNDILLNKLGFYGIAEQYF